MSREILDLLYVYYHRAYCHQTWQVCDLQWKASTYKVAKPFELTWGHVINWKYFIFTIIIFKATKPSTVVTYNEELPSIKLQDIWSRSLARSRDKLNLLYLQYHNDY